jgi:hypothetical protein
MPSQYPYRHNRAILDFRAWYEAGSPDAVERAGLGSQKLTMRVLSGIVRTT